MAQPTPDQRSSAIVLIAVAAGVVGLALLVLSVGAIVAMVSMGAAQDQPAPAISKVPVKPHKDAAKGKSASGERHTVSKKVIQSMVA